MQCWLEVIFNKLGCQSADKWWTILADSDFYLWAMFCALVDSITPYSKKRKKKRSTLIMWTKRLTSLYGDKTL